MHFAVPVHRAIGIGAAVVASRLGAQDASRRRLESGTTEHATVRAHASTVGPMPTLERMALAAADFLELGERAALSGSHVFAFPSDKSVWRFWECLEVGRAVATSGASQNHSFTAPLDHAVVWPLANQTVGLILGAQGEASR